MWGTLAYELNNQELGVQFPAGAGILTFTPQNVLKPFQLPIQSPWSYSNESYQCTFLNNFCPILFGWVRFALFRTTHTVFRRFMQYLLTFY